MTSRAFLRARGVPSHIGQRPGWANAMKLETSRAPATIGTIPDQDVARDAICLAGG